MWYLPCFYSCDVKPGFNGDPTVLEKPKRTASSVDPVPERSVRCAAATKMAGVVI